MWQSREIIPLVIKSLTDSCWTTFLAQVFFTFYFLCLIKKKIKNLRIFQLKNIFEYELHRTRLQQALSFAYLYKLQDLLGRVMSFILMNIRLIEHNCCWVSSNVMLTRQTITNCMEWLRLLDLALNCHWYWWLTAAHLFSLYSTSAQTYMQVRIWHHYKSVQRRCRLYSEMA